MDQDIKIHPSSVLVDRKVPTIMYDEIVSLPLSLGVRPVLNIRVYLQNVTTAFYAHTVSVIEESWLDEIPGFNQRSIQQLSSA